jgi:hypothetical protein
MRRERVERCLSAVSVLVFTIFAANFLYFFVDDEAIPYVYAQNLIRGRGLVYNMLEGRVEGYSDFLHVLESAGILSLVRALGMPKIDVFFVGKALSFLAGLSVVVLVLAIARRMRIGLSGQAGGMALLILTGPLAVWSCSSLETVPVALGVTALVWALVVERDTVALLAGSFLILERIDGFVYAGALLAAFLLVAAGDRRRVLARRVVAPLTLLFLVYHAGRILYFGTLLPTPLEAKVLYKLIPHDQVVKKAASEPYLLRFVESIGWTTATALLVSAVVTIREGGAARAIALASVALVAYVSVVGDWMFGFRFFVPVLPLAALVFATSLGSVGLKYPRVAGGAALASTLWCAALGAVFTRTYIQTNSATSFLRQPSREVGAYFRPYYSLYTLAQTHIAPDTVVADNQAGFLPFMLDLVNIDDLGICSRFYADLPTTDTFFTEVGKYQPLTPGRVMRAGEAYLLYQNAQYLLVRSDLLRTAHADHVPASLLDDYYELLAHDDVGNNAIYRRTTRPAERFRETPNAFLENLAHVSYLTAARVDGEPVSPQRYVARFPYLHDGTAMVDFTRATSLQFDFGPGDEPALHVSVRGVAVSEPATLVLALRSDGTVIWTETVDLEAGQAKTLWFDLPDGTTASSVELRVAATNSRPATVRISDMRVLGQTARLRSFIASRLKFRASGTVAPVR